MVDVKISELPVAGSAAGTDQLEANQAGTSRSITVAQVGTALALTGYAPLASPVFTGDPQAPTPATADSDTSVATTAFVKAQGYQTAAQVTTSLGSYLPLTGGTLAGPGTLAGTTATFSGALTSGNHEIAQNNPALKLRTTAATVGWRTGSSVTGSTDGYYYIQHSTDNFVANFQNGLQINADGTAQLFAGLTGTSATFSGTVSAPGAQIQMVSTQTGAMATGTTIIPYDDTIPQITEGDQYMTLAITPKSATSKLIIDVAAVASSSVNPVVLIIALFQDATANALAANLQMANGSAAGQPFALTLRHSMTSGTTSATTFRVRIGANVAATTTFNGSGGARLMGGVMASSIVIREVA